MTDTPLFDRPAAAQDLRENRSLRIHAPPAAPRDYAAELDEWIRQDPRQWRALGIMVRQMTRREGRWSIAAAVEWLRYYVVYRKRGEFKFNNSWRAAAARRLAAEHPSIAERAEFRRSRSGPMPYPDARVCPGARTE